MVNFNTKQWKPVKEGEMKHKLAGKRFYYLKFEGNFDIDEIREFAQKKSDQLQKDGRVRQIQVSVVYSDEYDRSGKMTNVGDEVDVKDLRNQYNYNLGDITAFYIYLS